MGTKMTLSGRAELTNAVRRRYGAEKRKILDEFIAATGYHDKVSVRPGHLDPWNHKGDAAAALSGAGIVSTTGDYGHECGGWRR